MGMAEFTTLRWIVWTGAETIEPEHFEAFVQIAARSLGVGTKPPPNAGTDPPGSKPGN
jgi:hypothetical protein